MFTATRPACADAYVLPDARQFVRTGTAPTYTPVQLVRPGMSRTRVFLAGHRLLVWATVCLLGALAGVLTGNGDVLIGVAVLATTLTVFTTAWARETFVNVSTLRAWTYWETLQEATEDDTHDPAPRRRALMSMMAQFDLLVRAAHTMGERTSSYATIARIDELDTAMYNMVVAAVRHTDH